MSGGVSHHFQRFFQSWNELMLAFARNDKFKVQLWRKISNRCLPLVHARSKCMSSDVLQIFHSPPCQYIYSGPIQGWCNALLGDKGDEKETYGIDQEDDDDDVDNISKIRPAQQPRRAIRAIITLVAFFGFPHLAFWKVSPNGFHIHLRANPSCGPRGHHAGPYGAGSSQSPCQGAEEGCQGCETKTHCFSKRDSDVGNSLRAQLRPAYTSWDQSKLPFLWVKPPPSTLLLCLTWSRIQSSLYMYLGTAGVFLLLI